MYKYIDLKVIEDEIVEAKILCYYHHRDHHSSFNRSQLELRYIQTRYIYITCVSMIS